MKHIQLLAALLFISSAAHSSDQHGLYLSPGPKRLSCVVSEGGATIVVKLSTANYKQISSFAGFVRLNGKSLFHNPERVKFAALETEGDELNLGVGSLDVQYNINIKLRTGEAIYEVGGPKLQTLTLKGTCRWK
ncbi:hypothetical protein [Methylocystis parvus]|uniref:Auto-transporter adhesin head GIN domain-containing protein n=1 Tax=Methylocystis parvus TaxID=134 RepID=A0A6B8M6A2_9HYPH|nr:hypothetical protein [Methylocystis parvus]QGM97988.1 hypothetical protein F7D14_11215 [Methylocystis parvus]WBK01697.1 hypothetical protein MMG94_08355 [Methylocystis parvus OBBP]